MRLIVATGGGSDEASAIADLAASLKPSRRTASFTIGCVDLGFAESTRTQLTPEFDLMVRPEWPRRDTVISGDGMRERTDAIPPFLPDMFPAFDVYVWIAPNAFVQTPAALALLSRACAGGFAAVIPAIDRSYNHRPEDQQALMDSYRATFGPETAQRMAGPFFTANVVAAAANSPLWQALQQSYRLALDRTADASGLAPLNHALRSAEIPQHRLPAVCNWQSHLALPQIDFARGGLVEPSYPFDPLWIIADTFNETAATHELTRRDGGTLRSALTFSALRQALRAHRGVPA